MESERTPSFLVDTAKDLVASPSRAEDDQALFTTPPRGREASPLGISQRCLPRDSPDSVGGRGHNEGEVADEVRPFEASKIDVDRMLLTKVLRSYRLIVAL